MKLNTLIAKLRALKVDGSTEVFITGDDGNTHTIRSVKVERDATENYPDDWNMPDTLVNLMS